jgi:hypothetical protein
MLVDDMFVVDALIVSSLWAYVHKMAEIVLEIMELILTVFQSLHGSNFVT